MNPRLVLRCGARATSRDRETHPTHDTHTARELTTRTKPPALAGIATAEDAYERIRAGASLVELYTALAYEGPGLPGRLNADLERLLEKDGFASVAEAVGVDAIAK